jgi:hypothetical protein
MMTPPINPPLLQLTQRPDLGILVGRWAYQPAPSELPAVYQQIMDEALHGRNRFWLQDIRRRTLNDHRTTQWLLNSFFPDMASRLGGRLYVAYLVGPALHETIVARPDFISAQALDDKPFVTAFFVEEGAAIKWLQAQQSAVAR